MRKASPRAGRSDDAMPTGVGEGPLPASTLWRGPDGWFLAPEGAVVHPAEKVAVIADVHLGYEWARGRSGDCVPAHSLIETVAKLRRILACLPIERVVVAGDLVESPKPCRRTDADVQGLSRWLGEQGVSLTAVLGNHDSRAGGGTLLTCEVGGWTIGHGDRPINALRTISGHVHPVLRSEGVMAPAFLVGPSTIVLPAFSSNAAGWNVAGGGAPEGFRGRELRCVVDAGGDWLDFGLIDAIPASRRPVKTKTATRRRAR